jgi:hypothetical protein
MEYEKVEVTPTQLLLDPNNYRFHDIRGYNEVKKRSQTSLLHAFAPETWMIETSFGEISLWDSALRACSEGMFVVTALPQLQEDMGDIARQLSEAFARTSQTSNSSRIEKGSE